MSAGFGFSVGDFIAALRLVGTVIDVLRESSCATSSLRSLIDELYALETALLRVKRLDPEDGGAIDVIALRSAASQCQKAIDRFYRKIQKYQPHLQQQGTDSKVKDAWMKIKWALCKKDDLETFRAEIRGQTGSLEILLLSISMQSTKIQAKKQEEQFESLGTRMQQFSFQVLKKLGSIANGVAKNIEQGKLLLESSAQIIHTSLRTFQIVRDIHLLVLRIPGQVQRQQPVYLIDPYNKESPFHLEFVRSAEALLAILKVNLEDSGCGPEMIDRGEFAIEEMGTKSMIDITNSWEMCFYPGQRVAMSMVFKPKDPNAGRASCPRCDTNHTESVDKEIICVTCGTVFRRIEEIHDDQHQIDQRALDHRKKRRDISTLDIVGPEMTSHKRKRVENDEAVIQVNLRKFRRIRLISPLDGTKVPVDMLEGQRSKVYELRNNIWHDRGMGYCIGQFVDGVARLLSRLEDDPSQVILDENINKDAGYQIQQGIQTTQDTLLVWTSLDETSMALSFQDYEGCARIWDFIERAQDALGRMTLS